MVYIMPLHVVMHVENLIELLEHLKDTYATTQR